jgi:tetratricopeptide (TPR) repeat protein
MTTLLAGRALVTGAAVLLVLAALAGPCVRAQDRTRGLHIRVGATGEEAASGREVRLWAVVVGVSRFKYGGMDLDGSEIKNLKNADDDAQRIYDFLRSPEGGGFRDVSEGGQMVLLKDEQATKAEVERALAALKQSKPEDYFVIYVAAHGTVVPQRSPATGRTEEVPYFVVHDTDVRDMQRTAIRMEAFQQAVREIPAQKGLVLSDTCHSAGVQLVGRGMHVADTQRANSRLIEEMSQIPPGVGFISAADQTELSYESGDLNQGVFTHCLLKALGGLADADRDNMVTFGEVKTYLRGEVPRLTGGKQNPQFNTTTIETNKIPLALVRYTDLAGGADAEYGTLLIRTPDVDGVEVAVDGVALDAVDSRTERRVQVRPGDHRLLFAKGQQRQEVLASVAAGAVKPVEVYVTFSASDEDALIATGGRQVNVYLREDREPSTEARDLFLEGVESFNKQKFEAASELFDRAVRANGGAYADALVYRGRAEQSLDRDAAAVATFQAALALRPSDFETRTLLAEAKLMAGHNLDEVVADLKRIIAKHPNYCLARAVLADALIMKRDLIGAEQQLRRAINVNPNYPPAHMMLAGVLTHQESPERQKEAVAAATKAVQLFEELSRKRVSTSRGLKHLSLSHVLFGGGRYRNDKVMAEAHYMLAKALTRAVYYDEMLAERAAYLDLARGHLREAVKLAESAGDKLRLAQLRDTSAQNYLLKGDVPNAIADGELALKASESMAHASLKAQVHFTLYLAYQSNQNFAKAAEHLQKYIEVYGSSMDPEERRARQDELDHLRRQAAANRRDN